MILRLAARGHDHQQHVIQTNILSATWERQRRQLKKMTLLAETSETKSAHEQEQNQREHARNQRERQCLAHKSHHANSCAALHLTDDIERMSNRM